MAERSAAEGYFGAIEFELNRERAAVLGRYGRNTARVHQLYSVPPPASGDGSAS
jgi:hypothetical protein